MYILQEIEAMRKRVLQEINIEFDILLEHIANSDDAAPSREAESPYEIKYPLTAGGGIFKGKKPSSVIIGGEHIPIQRWKQLVEAVLKRCMAEDRYRLALLANAGNISGKTRALLSKSPDQMRSPVHIGSGLYVETHYDVETLLHILINRFLLPIGYDVGNIYVTIKAV